MKILKMFLIESSLSGLFINLYHINTTNSKIRTLLLVRFVYYSIGLVYYFRATAGVYCFYMKQYDLWFLGPFIEINLPILTGNSVLLSIGGLLFAQMCLHLDFFTCLKLKSLVGEEYDNYYDAMKVVNGCNFKEALEYDTSKLKFYSPFYLDDAYRATFFHTLVLLDFGTKVCFYLGCTYRAMFAFQVVNYFSYNSPRVGSAYNC